MNMDNTAGHWGPVAKAMHWGIAALVFVQLPLGVYAHRVKEAAVSQLDLSRAEEVTALFHLHKSIGLLIGLLVIARLAWRLTHYVPPLSGEMPLALRVFAHATHWLLYLVLLTLAGSGLTIALGSPVGLKFFGLIQIPQLFDLGRDARETVELVHKIAVWTAASLVTLHVAAAIFHHFALKDDTMVKMWPALLGGRGGPARGGRT